MVDVIESVQRFLFDRLPKQPLFGSKPCLAEDWFVIDARPTAPNWLSDADLRKVWRIARAQRLGFETGAGCPWLLLHQVTDLTSAMLNKASEILIEQRSVSPQPGKVEV